MTSAVRSAANRRNAAKSTGPRTAAGKAVAPPVAVQIIGAGEMAERVEDRLRDRRFFQTNPTAPGPAAPAVPEVPPDGAEMAESARDGL